jgi:hypothetical protein
MSCLTVSPDPTLVSIIIFFLNKEYNKKKDDVQSVD